MKNKKILISSTILMLFVISLLTMINLKSDQQSVTKTVTSDSKRIIEAHAAYSVDPQDTEKITEFADNVFVAKVIKEEGTYYENVTGNPDTVYRLKIIQNIKGELSTSKPVKIYQHGGPQKDGTVIQFEDERALEKGSYYIFTVAVQGATTDEEKAKLTLPEGSLLELPGSTVALGREEAFALKATKVKEFDDASKKSNPNTRTRFSPKDSEAYFSD